MEASIQGQVGFQVTRQDNTPTFDPNVGSATEWTIHFTTKPSGVEAQVTVPEADYQPEKVAALIMEKARNIEAVHALNLG